MQYVKVAEVLRSGFVESVHAGSVVALAPEGSPAWSVGDVTVPVFPRSCNKPLQAAGMVDAGLSLPARLLALACGSHSGEHFHLEGVREILAAAGLDETALATPPDWPIDEVEREAWIRAWWDRSSVANNCSGKHAAMLATCRANGWETNAYRAPDHPLQRHLAAAFADLTGEPVSAVGVDGCGAPLFATSLTGLARGFRRLALGPVGSPEGRVAAAIREYPTYVSGTRRDEARLLAAYPGMIAKSGAEACYAVALSDGTSVALKIADGGGRARPVVMAAALRRLGLSGAPLDHLAAAPVLGAGVPVGQVRAVL